MNTGKMILSIAVGVAAGAVIGVLLAPDKGSETRKRISDKSNKYADGLKQEFSDLVENMLNKFDSIKSEAENLAHKGMNKVEDAKNATKKPMNQ